MPRFEESTCAKCGDQKIVPCFVCDMSGLDLSGGPCRECKGELYVECPACDGEGRRTKNKMIGRSNRKR